FVVLFSLLPHKTEEEISDYGERAKEYKSCVEARKTRLHLSQPCAENTHQFSQTIHRAVDNTDINYLPESICRDPLDRSDNDCVVDFIYIVLALKNLRHNAQRLGIENYIANSDAQQAYDCREQRGNQFCAVRLFVI